MNCSAAAPLRLAVALGLLTAACAPDTARDTIPAAGEVSIVAAEWCANLPRPGYASVERVPLPSESWFEVYAVGEGVFALYEPNQWQEAISYLVVGSERALLFDTGMGMASIRAVVDELWDGPVVVLNSHTHFDHIGGNHEFDEILAMDTDYTRENARGSSNEDVREDASAAALCAPLPEGVTEDTYAIRPFGISEFVRDGHTISLGDRTLEIVHVPGHTDDAIALLDRGAGYLWTGDSFYEGPIWLFWPGTDLEAYRRSTERMAALAPTLERVFPAHNTAVAQPSRLIMLRDAFSGALDGTLAGVLRDDGLMSYDVGAFSLLMRAPDDR
jgi:glyoxylase-like metal-dependent hydrolase (beta-lactamase superfamily II)